MADILIVDDEKILASSLKMVFSDEGHVASAVHSRAAVLEQLEKLSPDVILLDLRLPDGSGMEVLRTIRSVLPEALVIMMTAFGDTALVVEAIKLGAFDYIGKPFELQEILLLVEKALAQQKLRDEVTFLRSRQHGTELAEMVGNCEAMSEVCERIRLVAGAGDSAVLVTGESGTGKELVASALHKLSDRRRQAFVEVNCAAIPENLLESELFGFEKGAFTDAQSRKKGLFELAQDGTIFLDEIGEMPLHLQAKLLRFLEKHSFRRLGGTSDITINARIVAATNRDLRERVQQGAFREDLFYRLNVIPIHLPPLRERDDDILLLARHFLDLFSRRLGRPAKRLSSEVEAAFGAYAWPGNIRELKNIIERLVILSPGEVIKIAMLPLEIQGGQRVGARTGGTPGPGFDLERHLLGIELGLVEQALAQAGGRRTLAAERLGLSRHALKRRMYKLGLMTEADHE
ncbi:MAG: sigma-54-dependent transcriptional regulator [Geoalkalibacter sp.]|uniref:sigma-54-dependent transcriptional regulator n=1 Tax=Geoalkalibacter sp. TaxID=3041440 RepID=UPI003D139655